MKSLAPSNASRRLFLRQSAAMASLGAGAPLALNLAAMGSAAAQTAGNYKALVCVYLNGGNDAYNTVLPTDSASWSAYTKVRNQQPSSIALDGSKLLPLHPVSGAHSRSPALHPQLSGLQDLFNNQRRLAIVSNVGPLVEPLTKNEYTLAQKRRPAKLFSHNDQQSSWQALGPEGAALGWGGRLADAVAASNGASLFTGISASGNAVWVSGQNVKQYQMQSSGVLRLGVTTGATGADQIFGSAQVAAAMQRIAGATRSNHLFEKDVSDTGRRSIEADRLMGSALPSSATAPYGPDTLLQYTRPDGSRAINPLAQQLQVVARAIGARTSLAMKRQVFFVSLGGFDTHDDQNTRHADLMARLNHAMMYFDTVLGSLGLRDDVTTFTASDFGRTFTSNGDGTDHGWGGHHFVMGGAVQGGSIIGDLPTYSLKNANDNNFNGSPDQLGNGVMLPKISVEQYGSALGRWFGAGSALSTVFPNLGNFSTQLDLMSA